MSGVRASAALRSIAIALSIGIPANIARYHWMPTRQRRNPPSSRLTPPVRRSSPLTIIAEMPGAYTARMNNGFVHRHLSEDGGQLSRKNRKASAQAPRETKGQCKVGKQRRRFIAIVSSKRAAARPEEWIDFMSRLSRRERAVNASNSLRMQGNSCVNLKLRRRQPAGSSTVGREGQPRSRSSPSNSENVLPIMPV